jgi:hypothetical protein
MPQPARTQHGLPAETTTWRTHVNRKLPATTTTQAAPARTAIESGLGVKITVVMLERHAGYLDIMAILMRMRHHKAVPRTEMVRALVEFMQRSGVDFSQFSSVGAIVVYLTAHFKTIARPGGLQRLLQSSLLHPRSRKPRSTQTSTGE